MDEFSFRPDDRDDGAGVRPEGRHDTPDARPGNCAPCPLARLAAQIPARIPARAWRDLFRPPFRRRHPVLWWTGALLLLALAGLAGRLSVESAGGERIALITVRGPILDVAPTLAWIRTLEHNADVKGVLLRVDSPGGGAAASQELYDALARLGTSRPLAASMGSTAASGGLMVSMAARRVFANPSTVTGSIGVRMDIPQLQGLLGKIGVGQETLTTAPFKDAGSWLRPLTPRDRAYFEHVLMNMHEQFVDIVARGRSLPREKAAALADGKIFTGQEALGLGLVDALGGEDAALAWLAEQSGVPASRPLLTRSSRTGSLLERLLAALREMAGLGAALDLAGRMADSPAQWPQAQSAPPTFWNGGAVPAVPGAATRTGPPALPPGFAPAFLYQL